MHALASMALHARRLAPLLTFALACGDPAPGVDGGPLPDAPWVPGDAPVIGGDAVPDAHVHVYDDAARDAAFGSDHPDALPAPPDGGAPSCLTGPLAPRRSTVLEATEPAAAPRTLGPGRAPESMAALAFGGGVYLGAWVERVGDPANASGPMYLYAARFDAAGRMIDLAPTLLSRAAGEVAVASDGADFLVVWPDARDFAARREDVYGTRITAAGAVSDPGGRPIAAGPGEEASPRVAWTGAHYLVTHHRWNDGGRILGTRVDRAGRPLDEQAFPIAASASSWSEVAGGAGEALVVWPTAGGRLVAARLDGRTVRDATPLLVTASLALNPARPAIAWTGTRWWVVWAEGTGGVACDASVYAAPLGGAPVRVDVEGHAFCGGVPSAAWMGGALAVAYRELPGAALCALSDPGEHRGCRSLASPPSVNGLSEQTALARGADGGLLAFARHDLLGETQEDILLVRVGADARPAGDEVRAMPAALAPHAHPAVASGEGGHLVVWCDAGGPRSAWHVVAMPVDVSGRTGAAAIAGQTRGLDCWPAVTAHAGGYLVAWADAAGEVRATRTGADGVPLDDPPLLLGDARAGDLGYVPEPAVGAASSGGESLVAWRSARLDRSWWIGSVRAVRVGASGEVLDATPLEIAATTNAAGPLAVAASGAGFLVGYAQGSAGGYGAPWGGWTLAVTAVGRDGTPGPTSSLGSGVSLSLIEIPGGWLAGWIDPLDRYAFLAVRLAHDGVPCAAPARVEAGEDLRAAVLAVHREGVLLFAARAPGGGEPWWTVAPFTGETLEATGEATRGHRARTLAASSAGGRVLFTYDLEDPESGHRVHVRALP